MAVRRDLFANIDKNIAIDESANSNDVLRESNLSSRTDSVQDGQNPGAWKEKLKQPYIYKLLIHGTSKPVEDMVIGISKTFPGFITDRRTRVVMTPHEDVSQTVGLVSGGGAGHEPFPSGLVGKGMLTASVSGPVFTTPSSSFGLAAIYNVNLFKKGGVLVLILNYGGTMLHFNQACEFARDLRIKTDTLVVGEDCSLQKAGNKKVLIGRRGLVGIVFVIKIAGAMSVRGAKLAVIKWSCSEAVNLMASITIGNRCCIVPGQIEPHFMVRPNHIQLGVGVHGQSGNETIEFTSSRETVRIIVKKIGTVLKLGPGNSVCAIVSSLGGSTLLECYTIAADLTHELAKMQISLERVYVATLFSALDMGGLQVCILKVTEENIDWISCLDEHTDAPAWPGRAMSFEKSRYLFKEVKFNKIQYSGKSYGARQIAIFKSCIERIAHKIMDAQDIIEKLGRIDGHSNIGMDFKIFAEVILQELNDLPFTYPKTCLLRLSNLASEEMGGISGGLYSLMLKAASQEAPNWPKCLEAAIQAVTHYTSAKLGDKTILKVLMSVGGRDAKAMTYNCLRRCLSCAVANKLSYSGVAAKDRAKTKKIAFKTTQLCKIINVAVKKIHPSSTDQDLKVYMCHWLQQANSRIPKWPL